MTEGAPREHDRVCVLAVDDEPFNLDLLERSLRRKYDVLSASSGEQALEILRDSPDRERIAIILCDYRMPGMSGAELLAESMRTHPDARRVVITGYADSDNLIAAINDGRIHYLVTKPWKHQELAQLLDQLRHAWELERQNRRLLGELQGANDDLRARERQLARNLDERGRDLMSATHELERVSRELEVQAFKDALTGLYNHRAFQERLAEEVARARRHGQPLALIYGDVDQFSRHNRELGYQIGDEILRRVADLVRAGDSPARVRASDVVARFGGEEFCVLLPETSKDGARTKAERLREAIALAAFPGGRPVTMSFGLACFPSDGNSPEEVLRHAEAAMQAAKGGGRNRVHLYSDEGLGVPAAPASEHEPEDTGEHSDVDGRIALPDMNRFPTYYERLDHIISTLRRERAASCLFVDLSRLRQVELEVGVASHAEVFVLAGNILDEMRGSHLRDGDVICRTQEDDGYLCILSPARKGDGRGADALEEVARRVEDHLNTTLAEQASHILRQHPRVIVGHARVLGNSMIRSERLVARLVAECRESAVVQRQRAAHANKSLLQELILGDALTPVYQPIVHLKTGETFGYEALIRGPRGTPLESPYTLFSVADEVDLTFELDRACFRTCLRGAIGLEPVHRLFVNLLPLSFYDASFIETEVNHLLEAAALTPANVVFEITERLAIENFAAFRRALARYTAMGFGVAIDDVGTRHSNLETVMALRPNLIKVSDVLTNGISRSTVKREMLKSLVRIAEAIDSVVVAEGVETPDDLVVLHDVGVLYGQGFYLARPGPPFPRLRSSVKRAIATLAVAIREPIPAPPADFDDEGDSRETTRPHALLMATVDAVDAIAKGSGKYVVVETPPAEPMVSPADELDDFDDETKPRLERDDEDAWSALRDGGNGEGPRALIDGLRATLRGERSDRDESAEAGGPPGRPAKPQA